MLLTAYIGITQQTLEIKKHISVNFFDKFIKESSTRTKLNSNLDKHISIEFNSISNNFEFNENQSKIDINSKRYPITIFEGNVMELNSKEAIPLVTVTLRGEDGINRGALTDSTGFFLIKDIPLGECSMDISSNGYQEIMFDFNIKEHAYYKCEIKLKQFEIEIFLIL